MSEGHGSKREVENMKPQDNGKARIKGRLRFAFSMLFLQRSVVLQGLEMYTTACLTYIRILFLAPKPKGEFIFLGGWG